MELRSLRDDEIDSTIISVYGYPDYIDGKVNYDLLGMDHNFTLNRETNHLRYVLDTSSGQSGLSLFYKSPEDNKYYITGVHEGLYKECRVLLRMSKNKGDYSTF